MSALEAALGTIQTGTREEAESAYMHARKVWTRGNDSLRIRQLRREITTAAAIRLL